MPEIIKGRTTTYKILQVGIDMFVFDESYRRIRGGAKYKGFQCYACNKKFSDGEKISLAITNKGNKTLCNACATQFESELEGK